MTLLTEHIEAGWHEVESGVKWAAERFISLPGASSSVVRVEADSSSALQKAVSLRESQLSGRLGAVKDVVTNDGSLVTGEQHEAVRTTDGVSVIGDPVEPASDAEVEAASKAAADAAAEEAARAERANADKDAEIESLRTQLADAQAAADAAPPDAPAEDPAQAPEADPAPAADAGVGEASAAPQE